MNEIVYSSDIKTFDATKLNGFFVGWKHPLTPDEHYKLLKSSSHFVVATDSKTGNIVGFITAVSDGVLSAFIPLLEVLPAYQKLGIGKSLTEKMLNKLKDIKNIDLICDECMQAFYKQFKMHKAHGMIIRK